MEDIFAEALDALLEKVDPGRRLGGKQGELRPLRSSDSNSRRIPQAVKDAVWSRDGGCCAYVGPAGRCGSRAFLEFDHVVPFALGGASGDPGNIRLLCRAHNQLEGRRLLG
ncbi:MAG: HNH endonuclease [Elusimicrobia bacterium]|nr:HNH endonuclease [Elusimicrobiota bacterium]